MSTLTLRPTLPGRILPALAVVIALGAVGAALYTQHMLDMQPCAWCVLQRVIFVAIALAALPALLVRARPAQWFSGLLMGALALCGVAAALWQHFVAASSQSCNLTLADRIVGGLGLDNLLPQVFAAYASCADAATRLVGVPYEFWSLALFVLLLLLAMPLLRRRR
ncbi:MAG: disulfide bond formation protein B [Rubrivivax sp.]